MIKLLSCLLSFTIIFTSVTPSLAQRGRIFREKTKKTGEVLSEKAKKMKKQQKLAEKTTRGSRATFGLSKNPSTKVTTNLTSEVKETKLERYVAKAIREDSGTRAGFRGKEKGHYRTDVPGTKTGQILTHEDLTEGIQWLRSDLVALVSQRDATIPEVNRGLEIHRTQLKKVTSEKLAESSAEMAGTVADISALGLLGAAEKDAGLILEVYQKSKGTEAEAAVTVATSRALLNLGAYEKLGEMSEMSEIHPELWDGISSYAKEKNLPLTIFERERTVVDMTVAEAPLKKVGEIPTWATHVEKETTVRYMEAGQSLRADVRALSEEKLVKPQEQTATIEKPASERYWEVFDDKTPSEQPTYYASAGDGVANTEKVQPKVETAKKPETPAAQTTTTSVPTPKVYAETTTTNKIGGEVTTWQRTPEYAEPEVSAASNGQKLTLKDRTAILGSSLKSTLQTFTRSRIAPLVLTIAALAPTSEGAVHTALHDKAPNKMERVENVRAAQRGVISEEAQVVSGSGGALKDEVNRSGMAAQRAAQRTAEVTEAATKTETKTKATTSSTKTTGIVTRPVKVYRGTSGIAAVSLIPMPKSWMRTLTGQGKTQESKQKSHVWMDEGLDKEGLDATFDVVLDEKTGETAPVTFHFEDEATKEAFYKRVNLAEDEYFVFDAATGAIIIRQHLTDAQKANGAKPRDRGFNRIFFKGAQKAPTAIFETLFASKMARAFGDATKESDVMALLSDYKASLKLIMPQNLLAKYPELKAYFNMKTDAEVTEVQAKENALVRSGTLIQIAKDISDAFAEKAKSNAGKENTPIEVFKDEVGYLALLLNGFAEGTLGTMGQAITSALGALGIEKGGLSNTPTAAGQFGPMWAPFIGAWTQKYGTRRMLAIGQMLGTTGHATAAVGLLLGAVGALPPLAAFAAMVGGITINGIAGALLKQDNPLLAKQRASDPVSSSATITDLNSWASVGGMYCYLFLPVIGGIVSSIVLGGNPAPALGILASMFGMAASVPLMANLLLRNSRIKNNPDKDNKAAGIFSTIGKNLKAGFKSPFIRNMFFATAGAHFMGLAFNSGPGHFIKENISDPSMAILTSFLAIYLTVFGGRKLGAKAMKAGIIGDKALAGLSATIGVAAGAASIIPGLDFVTRCVLWATAGMGFANWANVLQSIELNRPENADKRAAVSTMYILARTSGMLTGVMGLFGDALQSTLGLSPSSAALYALTMPLAAGAGSLLINRKYITKELVPTVKRWFTKKKTVDTKETAAEGSKEEGVEGNDEGPSLEDGATAN